MIIDQRLLDDLTDQAKKNPRLRQAYDLRTTSEDNSQRILNACELGTILPIHRHRNTTETIICLRGRCVQYLYRENEDVSLTLVDVITMEPGGEVPAMSVEVNQWHRLESQISGTVILECKDGKYEPLKEEDVWTVDTNQ